MTNTEKRRKAAIKMRRVSAKELEQWSKDHSVEGNPFPIPSRNVLKEMEKEGMIFEIRKTKKGSEYPYINSDKWIYRDNNIE